MNIKKMVEDYQERIGQYSVAIDAEKALKSMAIKRGEPEIEIERHQSEI
jgi:hypothetical protein